MFLDRAEVVVPARTMADPAQYHQHQQQYYQPQQQPPQPQANPQQQQHSQPQPQANPFLCLERLQYALSNTLRIDLRDAYDAMNVVAQNYAAAECQHFVAACLCKLADDLTEFVPAKLSHDDLKLLQAAVLGAMQVSLMMLQSGLPCGRHALGALALLVSRETDLYTPGGAYKDDDEEVEYMHGAGQAVAAQLNAEAKMGELWDNILAMVTYDEGAGVGAQHAHGAPNAPTVAPTVAPDGAPRLVGVGAILAILRGPEWVGCRAAAHALQVMGYCGDYVKEAEEQRLVDDDDRDDTEVSFQGYGHGGDDGGEDGDSKDGGDAWCNEGEGGGEGGGEGWSGSGRRPDHDPDLDGDTDEEDGGVDGGSEQYNTSPLYLQALALVQAAVLSLSDEDLRKERIADIVLLITEMDLNRPLGPPRPAGSGAGGTAEEAGAGVGAGAGEGGDEALPNRCDANFAFWLRLVGRLIRCGSLPHRLMGISQIAETEKVRGRRRGGRAARWCVAPCM